MDAMSPFELDTVLHQPLRTRIAAFLATRDEATFTELKISLEVTDGNLESHIKKMVAIGYVRTKKLSVKKGRATTIYSLTKKGHEAFENYLEALKRILSVRL